MQPNDFMNIGNMHFWTIWLGIIVVVTLIGWPLLKMVKIVNSEEFQKEAKLQPFKKYIIFLIVGIILSTAIWTAWGNGRKLNTTDAKEDGAYQATMEGPEEPSAEELEVQAEEWKAPSQRKLEQKLREQENPNEVMRRAVERATANKPEKE
jgi:flagellar biosynthesis/type III secretory pathway M-ring protein FliF/YscJ